MSDTSLFLCDSIGFGECWHCGDTVPEHVTDKRFCSHECAASFGKDDDR